MGEQKILERQLSNAIIESLVGPSFPRLLDYSPANPLDFLDTIDHLNTLQDVQCALTSVARFYGFNFYATYLHLPGLNQPDKKYYMTESAIAWADYYRKQHYFLCDPSVRYVHGKNKPFTWDHCCPAH